MKKYLLLLTLSTFILQTAHSQTNVSGGIYANTTWTLANSPYIVVDTVVVFPGVTLTIEPGVVVRFDDNVTLEMRQSTLIALGTSSDSITFTSNNASPTTGIWKGIYFNNSAPIQINYCIFKYASNALDLSDYNQSIVIQNMSFSYNSTCLKAVSYPCSIMHSSFYNNGYCVPSLGDPGFVDSCIFVNNFLCVAAVGIAHITNSDFEGNELGLGVGVGGGSHTGVINCTFCSNGTACHNGDSHQGFNPYTDSIFNCGFSNNHLAFSGLFEYMVGNVFTGNDTAFQGFVFDSTFMYNNSITENGIGILSSSTTSPFVYNNIVCNNHTYNFRYISANNGSFPGLCFCDTDSAAIAATIYDGYDDITLGLLTFTPVANCDSSALAGIPPIICSTFATGIQAAISKPQSGITIFPNPSSSDATLHSSTSFTNASLTIYNIYGQQVKQLNHLTGQSVTLHRDHLASGLYFIRLTENFKTLAVEKLVIED